MLEGEVQKLIHMEDRLHERVVGQDEAVALVANAIRRNRAGLSDPNRPIGSFIFLGPTGVGKTELAKALAQFMFDDDKAMVRVDMSEYMEKHSVSRMIGAPPGYVGYDEGGQLTEHVRRRPYSVILFDEIEKGHPDVFNTLLQILDDGRLTDGQGRTVDFKNTVIIMTSNVGSHIIHDANPIGFSVNQKVKNNSQEEVRKRLLEALRQTFRPEFLNRVDDIIVFNTLSKEHLEVIIDLQLKRIEKMLAERGLKLVVTKAAKELIISDGYDPNFGARPMRRSIQRLVQDPLALRLLAGEYLAGETVVVDTDGDGGKLRFEKAAEPVAV
jgi:ATP-dependent Clp protease ATP-binding subunit ClpB